MTRKTPIDAAAYRVTPRLDTGTHAGAITQMALTPDGRSLVTAGDLTIRIWDLATRRLNRMLLGQVAERADDVFGNGRVVQFAISPDGRCLVALKEGTAETDADSDFGRVTEVQVFDIATGNLQSRHLHPGLLLALDFSPDGRFLVLAGNMVDQTGRRAAIWVYPSRAVLQGGFRQAPQPSWQATTLAAELADDLQVGLRFLPAATPAGGPSRLLLAAQAWLPQRRPRRPQPGPGLLSRLSLHANKGLALEHQLDSELPLVPATLALNPDWAAVAIASPLRRGRRKLGQLLLLRHDDSAQRVLLTETPSAALVFSASGARLLVGMQNPVGAGDAAVVGAQSVTANVYAVDYNGVDLRSTYYAHDDSVCGLALLGDDTAISTGGDNQAIHFWDCRHRVGDAQAAIRGTGRALLDPGVSRLEDVMFGTVPSRLLPPEHPPRQQRFSLRSLTLRTNEPTAARFNDFETTKWFIPSWGEPVVKLYFSPDAYGDRCLLPPDLTLYVGSDDEWALWTRSGYYVASPQGDRAIGYHVSRGTDQEALFVRSDRFKAFQRRDIVEAVVKYGSEERARARGVRIDALDVAQMLPPQIELADPGVVVHDDSVSFSFDVQLTNPDWPLTDVWILRDGVSAWVGVPQPDRLRQRLQATLRLRPGSNTFKIQARTARSSAEPVMQLLQGPPAPAWSPQAFGARGRLFMLCVGVSDFAVADTPQAGKTQRLHGAHNDAMAVYNLLGKSTLSLQPQPKRPLRNAAFDGVEAALLVNAQATKAAILGELKRLCSLIQQRGRDAAVERDVLLVFLSGHGLRYQGEPDLYFFNHDLVPQHADATGLSMRELGECFASLPAEVVLVVDACHAGMAGSNLVQGLDAEELAQRVQAVSERGMYVLGAARAEELGREHKAGGLGVFTEALLQTLLSPRHLLPDGVGRRTRSVSMLSLVAGLQEIVPRVSARAGTPAQTPVCRLYGDLLPLTIYRVEGRPLLPILR